MDWIKEKIALIHSLRNNKLKVNEYDVYDLVDFVAETHDINVGEMHQEFIRNLVYIVPFTANATDEPEWPYHAKEILEGKYPIEKLPVHIRTLAKELYYR
ncbi:MAG: hypothetical protein K8R21_12620 [Leptospira sp.]|nr:hypothetical protein [Leptospira sp.]